MKIGPVMELCGIPVYVDDEQEEPIRIEHAGPAPQEFIDNVTKTVNYFDHWPKIMVEKGTPP